MKDYVTSLLSWSGLALASSFVISVCTKVHEILPVWAWQ
jgi:hypothetical protein